MSRVLLQGGIASTSCIESKSLGSLPVSAHGLSMPLLPLPVWLSVHSTLADISSINSTCLVLDHSIRTKILDALRILLLSTVTPHTDTDMSELVVAPARTQMPFLPTSPSPQAPIISPFSSTTTCGQATSCPRR